MHKRGCNDSGPALQRGHYLLNQSKTADGGSSLCQIAPGVIGTLACFDNATQNFVTLVAEAASTETKLHNYAPPFSRDACASADTSDWSSIWRQAVRELGRRTPCSGSLLVPGRGFILQPPSWQRTDVFVDVPNVPNTAWQCDYYPK